MWDKYITMGKIQTYKDSIDQLMDSENIIETVLIYAALTFFSFLLIPIFWVVGYNIRVLKSAREGRNELPDITEDIGGMLGDSILYMVAAFIYVFIILIIPALFLVVLFAILGIISLDSLIIITILFSVLMLVYYYFTPAIAMIYADTKSVSKTLNLSKVVDISMNADYVIAVVMSIALFAVTTIASLILTVTVIGSFFIPVLTAPLNILMFHIYGVAYRQIEQS